MKGAFHGIRCCCWSMIFISLTQAVPVSRSSEPGETQDGQIPKPPINNQVCIYENEIYTFGQAHPTSNPCETCVCEPPGFSCSLKTCDQKPGCKALHTAGQCCPDYICDCHRNGRTYGNGEKVEEPNPCNVCYCRGGEIQCAGVTCYTRSDCEPHYVPGKCCPKYDHCPAIETPNRIPSMVKPTEPPQSSLKPEQSQQPDAMEIGSTQPSEEVSADLELETVRPNRTEDEIASLGSTSRFEKVVGDLPKPTQEIPSAGTLEVVEIYPQHNQAASDVEKRLFTIESTTDGIYVAENVTKEVSKSTETATQSTALLTTSAERFGLENESNTTTFELLDSATPIESNEIPERHFVNDVNVTEDSEITKDENKLQEREVNLPDEASTGSLELGIVFNISDFFVIRTNKTTDLSSIERAEGDNLEEREEIGCNETMDGAKCSKDAAEMNGYYTTPDDFFSQTQGVIGNEATTEPQTPLENANEEIINVEYSTGIDGFNETTEVSTDIAKKAFSHPLRIEAETGTTENPEETKSIESTTLSLEDIYFTENSTEAGSEIENSTSESDFNGTTIVSIKDVREFKPPSNMEVAEAVTENYKIIQLTEPVKGTERAMDIGSDIIDLADSHSSEGIIEEVSVSAPENLTPWDELGDFLTEGYLNTGSTELPNIENVTNEAEPLGTDSGTLGESTSPLLLGVRSTTSEITTEYDPSIDTTTTAAEMPKKDGIETMNHFKMNHLNPNFYLPNEPDTSVTENSPIGTTTILEDEQHGILQADEHELETGRNMQDNEKLFNNQTDMVYKTGTAHAIGKWDDQEPGWGETGKSLIDKNSEENFAPKVEKLDGKLDQQTDRPLSSGRSTTENHVERIYPREESSTGGGEAENITDSAKEETEINNVNNPDALILGENNTESKESLRDLNPEEIEVFNTTYLPELNLTGSEMPIATVETSTEDQFITTDYEIIDNTTTASENDSNGREYTLKDVYGNYPKGDTPEKLLREEASSTVAVPTTTEETTTTEFVTNGTKLSSTVMPITKEIEPKRADETTLTLAEILLKWLDSKRAKTEEKMSSSAKKEHVVNSKEAEVNDVLKALTAELIKLFSEKVEVNVTEKVGKGTEDKSEVALPTGREGNPRSLDIQPEKSGNSVAPRIVNSPIIEDGIDIYSKDIENLAASLGKPSGDHGDTFGFTEDADMPIHLKYPFTDESLAPVLSMISDQLAFLKVGEEQPLYIEPPPDELDDEQKQKRGVVVVVPTSPPITVHMIKVVDGVKRPPSPDDNGSEPETVPKKTEGSTSLDESSKR